MVFRGRREIRGNILNQDGRGKIKWIQLKTSGTIVVFRENRVYWIQAKLSGDSDKLDGEDKTFYHQKKDLPKWRI